MEMKFSAAIRAGARLHPPAFGDFIQMDEQGIVHTCPLGAAFEAITGRLPPTMAEGYAGVITQIETTCGVDRTRIVTRPGADHWGTRASDVFEVITLLHDVDGWSRE